MAHTMQRRVAPVVDAPWRVLACLQLGFVAHTLNVIQPGGAGPCPEVGAAECGAASLQPQLPARNSRGSVVEAVVTHLSWGAQMLRARTALDSGPRLGGSQLALPELSRPMSGTALTVPHMSL